MKRILQSLCLMLCIVLLFVSCEFELPSDNTYVGTSYQITYIVDGKIVELTPDSYIAGEKCDLAIYDSERFLGWYSSPKNQIGDPISSISASDYGDKTFYAKFSAGEGVKDDPKQDEEGEDPKQDEEGEDPTPGKTELTDLFTAGTVGYGYTFSYADSDEIYDYEAEYAFCQNIIRYSYQDFESEDTYTDYLAYDAEEDAYTYYADNGDGSYTAYGEESVMFEYCALYIDPVYFFDLNPSHFEGTNGVYSPITDEFLQEEAAAFLGGAYDGETFTSMKITLESGVPVSAFIASTVEDEDDGTYTATYTVTFSDFGKTAFTLPEAKEESEEEEEEESSIAAAYQAADNTEVTVSGVVIGFVGNNFYLSDGEAGIYIYVGKTAQDAEVGDLVTITGTKTSFKGLTEIKTITALSVEQSGCDIEPEDLTELSDLESYLSMNVSAEGLTVSGLSGLENESGSDMSCSVSDGTNTVLFFIAKHISDEKRDEIYDVLSELTDGDILNVENAVVSCYSDYQLIVTESTVITAGELEVTGITANDITVTIGTSADQLTDLLTVFQVFSNGKKTALKTAEVTFSCPTFHGDVKGSYPATVTYGKYTADLTVTVAESTLKVKKEDIKTVDDIADASKLTHGLPSTGDVKVLVIPVDFTDYAAKEGTTANLEKAFFGDDLDWESLASYYEKASYGNLRITGTVLDVFHTGKSSAYYQKRYETNEDGDTLIIQAALSYYDETIDFSEYDTDSDGYIDALYIVYSAPICTDEYEDSMWWAYTYEYFTEDYEYYDGVEADYYTFLAYDFLFETPASEEEIDLNAETIIHESGHIIGLDDYYDYDETKGEDGGIGGGDMMDYNVGDHNAFSKLILGWVDPTVILGDCTVTLSSFGESGECLILPYAWNGSVFSEYLIIDYYTPDGLNALEAGASGLFSEDGIRIYHVDATLKNSNGESMWDIYQYNNSDTEHKLIRLIQADGKDEIEKKNEYSENDDLFDAGDIVKGLEWYDGSDINVKITVVSIQDGIATLAFDFQ